MSASGCTDTAFDIGGVADKTSPMIGVFAAAVVIISGLTDLVGRWNLGATVTIAYVIWCWLPLRTRLRELRRLWAVLYPFVIFFVWVVLSFAWQHPFISGLQNLTVLLVFLGLILRSSEAPHFTANCRFSTALAIAVWGASVLYASSLLVDGPGSSSIFGARVFGLFALVGISWYVAHWCSGVPKSLGFAAALLLLVALSLSRMAFAIGISLFTFPSFTAAPKGKRLRLIAVTVLFTAIALTAMSRFTAFTDRIEGEKGMMSPLNVGDVELDTSGRLVMWALVWQSYLDSPWVGKGAGSSADLVESTLSGIDHPHCDYLMLLHDYGIVGLMLFLLGLINVLHQLRKHWRASRDAHRSDATFFLATLFLLIAVFVAMFTDNCLSYIYLIAPLAIMVGVSLRTTQTCRVDVKPIPLPKRTSD
jgi:O-antigen ligase